jgi:hypothetical protein
MRRLLLVAAVILLYALHQDVWFWRTARPSPGSCRWAWRITPLRRRRARERAGEDCLAVAAERGAKHVMFAIPPDRPRTGIVAGTRSRSGASAAKAGRGVPPAGPGPFVFLLSLSTNMTAFATWPGHAFNGIVTFVIPLTLFFIGTRVWALGKKHGFITPVQLFRDRWEMSHIGTLIFVVQAALLIPYIIIGVMGGGTTLAGLSGGLVPFWLGGAIVALVVMSYVFFGGMRGTAWVNTLTIRSWASGPWP